ncbi:MAG TPA: MerR family transcriptional regulator, partial [Acidimicrobiales bacterium]|nr:MerR family transcriptional regulator [Acidimicrobiales bacterium]
EEGVDEGFAGSAACAIVGITYRQLDYWARTNLLRPSLAEAKGSGTQRLYAYGDVLELKVIKKFLDSGLSLQAARRAVECLRAGGEDLASANIVLTDASSVLARTGEELIDLVNGGQGVLNIFPLAGVVDELEAAIIELRSAEPEAAGSGRATG